MCKVVAVIVTYKPNVDVLRKTIDSIEDQIYKIILVDNTEGGFNFEQLQLSNKNKLKIIKLYDNRGIAKAQNIGIKMAMENEADYIMLSDQDTEYPPNYVKDMLKAIRDLSSNGSQIAAIGPAYKDLNKDRERDHFIIFNGFLIKKICAKKGYIVVSQLIASGVIIPVKVLKLVGFMWEDLFIDWVDTEWFWRATAKGYRIFGNANVVIKHRMGDKSVKVGHKWCNLHSPIRHYYTIRNGLYLALRSPYINLRMRIRLFIMMFSQLIAFTVLSTPHYKHFKYSLLGVYHGFIGRLGKL